MNKLLKTLVAVPSGFTAYANAATQIVSGGVMHSSKTLYVLAAYFLLISGAQGAFLPVDFSGAHNISVQRNTLFPTGNVTLGGSRF